MTDIKLKAKAELELYELYYDSGESIILNANILLHTISIYERNNKNPKMNKSGSLKSVREIVNSIKYGGCSNHRVTISKNISFIDKNLPIKPYTFGYWLGHGVLGHSSIYIPPKDFKEITKNIEDDGYQVREYIFCDSDKVGDLPKKVCGIWLKTDTKTKINEITSILMEFKVLNNRHIPDIYKRASFKQKFDLLRGLMDAKGCIERNGKCAFHTYQENFIKEVKELVNSLGIKTQKINMRKKRLLQIKGKKVFCGQIYRITFGTKLNIFKLKRKQCKHKNNKKMLDYLCKYKYIIKAKKV